MRSDRKDALNLRRSGKSYNEIKQILRVPKSTLSGWLHKTYWSNKVRKELLEKNREQNTIRIRKLNKIRGSHLKRLYAEAHKEAKEEFEQFKFHPLFISGISIYWGEGDKLSRGTIRVANVDPLMIKLFVKFLNEIYGIAKTNIRASILIYPDLNEIRCREFWIKQSCLPEKSFKKSILIQGRHKTKRVRYGVCSVWICSTYLKEKMMVWLNTLPKELIKGEYYLRP